MRKLRCFQVGGECVQSVLDEFNERADEFGVSESDIVSVSALPPTLLVNKQGRGGEIDVRVEVVIIYWSEK